MQDYKPNIIVIYCQNCVAENSRNIAVNHASDKFAARTAMAPCSSKIEASNLLKLLATGADGVEVVACPENQCRFLVGNVRAEKRVEYAKKLLETINMEPQRLGMSRGSDLSESDIMKFAELRADAVRALGANPMKGKNYK